MVDVEAIRRIAYRRVYWSDRWEDVAQRACLMALTRPDTVPALLVIDAIRSEFGRYRRSVAEAMGRMTLLERPEWIASHYFSEADLGERLFDETVEDELEAWAKMPAADRDRLVRESHRALNTSEVA